MIKGKHIQQVVGDFVWFCGEGGGGVSGLCIHIDL